MARTLREYFNGIADILASRALLAGDSSENADIGANREMICREFLEKHIPKRFAINIAGDVFGVGNKRSGQIDILVNHDMSMNFMENHKIRCPVESMTAAISVKSRLTKSEIHNALKNLASIPQCEPSVVNLGPLKKGVADYHLSWPSLFVFAFDGVECSTCVEHIASFYAENRVPFNRIPQSIIVNRKYLINFLQYQVPGATEDTTFDRAYLQVGHLSDNGRGAPLFWLMHEMAKGLSWLDGMYLDYGVYYGEAYG